jgi:hypothetical protein
VRVTFRTGPVGIGTYLVGHQGGGPDPQDVEVWLLLLFFPLVPLSRWRVSAAAGSEEGAEGETLELTLHSKSHVAVWAALGRIGRAAGATALTALPLAFGVWKVGSPWATPLLTALLGSFVGPGVLGKLGMAIEMGVVLAGATIPILVLMYLDERTPRVPLRSVLGIAHGRGSREQGEADEA